MRECACRKKRGSKGGGTCSRVHDRHKLMFLHTRHCHTGSAARCLNRKIPPPWEFLHNAGGSPFGCNWLWIAQPPTYWIEHGSNEPNALWPPRCTETNARERRAASVAKPEGRGRLLASSGGSRTSWREAACRWRSRRSAWRWWREPTRATRSGYGNLIWLDGHRCEEQLRFSAVERSKPTSTGDRVVGHRVHRRDMGPRPRGPDGHRRESDNMGAGLSLGVARCEVS